MNNFEKGMQKTMTISNSIPTLYLHDEIDITKLVLNNNNKDINSIKIKKE
jgi:hypothetical protein